jgi:DNA-binding NarL/FixJ family response regulator
VLSAQELQIAQLVAGGLSNKEIAERLYLSPQTIGSHLYRTFPSWASPRAAKLRVDCRVHRPSLARTHNCLAQDFS